MSATVMWPVSFHARADGANAAIDMRTVSTKTDLERMRRLLQMMLMSPGAFGGGRRRLCNPPAEPPAALGALVALQTGQVIAARVATFRRIEALGRARPAPEPPR